MECSAIVFEAFCFIAGTQTCISDQKYLR